MNEQIVLTVEGHRWTGWTSAKVSAGIDRLARDFSVTTTQAWPEKAKPAAMPLTAGQRVTVSLGEQLVMTGWIDSVPLRYDAKEIHHAIVGRSLTADLIDCAAAPKQFEDQNIHQILSELAHPFAITVSTRGTRSERLRVQRVQPSAGESVAEVISHLIGGAPVLAFDDADGQLVLSDIGDDEADTPLVLGENILRGHREKSSSDRFSLYTVVGQRRGDELDFGDETLTRLHFQTEDPAIGRYRPKYLRLVGNVTQADCRQRAQFEVDHRAALADEINYTVQGWRQPSGHLWAPNQTVLVTDPLAGFHQKEMVIAEAVYQQNSNGTVTQLRVGPPAAYAATGREEVIAWR